MTENVSHSDIEEIGSVLAACSDIEGFLVFIRFCNEQLNEDRTVQEIWSAWKDRNHD